jgi:hypothetical protein
MMINGQSQEELELLEQEIARNQMVEGQYPMEEEEPEGMTEDELLAAIREEVTNAINDFDFEIIQTPIDYYDGKLPAAQSSDDEADDAGSFNDYVSNEVGNAVEATLAEILPGFYGDQPVVFVPNGPGDDEQASSETKIVNHVFMTSNKGYTVLNRAFKDALLCRDALAKVYWDPSSCVYGERLRDVTPDILPLIPDISGGFENEDGTFTVDVKRVGNAGKPKVDWVPREEVFVNPDHKDITLDTARLVVHRRNVPASDLVAVGFDREMVDGLKEASSGTLETTGHDDLDLDTAHKSTRPITIAESYYRVDYDGDGIAELRRVITAGGDKGTDKLLLEEPWPEQPFAHGVAMFPARGFSGVSLYDRLYKIQDYKSDLMRQILDAGWRNLNQRIGVVERMANMDDLRTSNRGGYVRVKDPSAVFVLQDVKVPHESYMLIDKLDSARRESGGGAIDTAPQSQEIGVDSAHGLERIMSAIEQNGAMFAKNLAETLVSEIYLKLHRILKKHWRGVISARIEGTWLQGVPELWAERNATEVSVGLSMGTRLRQSQNIASVIAQQTADAQAGLDGILVNQNGMYNARVDYSRLMGVNYPERYWVNPLSEESKLAAQSKQQQAQQQAQQAQQEAEAQRQLMLQLEGIKAQAAAYQSDAKSETESMKANLDYALGVIQQRIKLIEMNAVHDNEPVPDSMGQSNAKADA